MTKDKKNILWKILLIVGCIPYAYIIFNAISNAINGDWGFCIGGDCSATYGRTAFKNTFFGGINIALANKFNCTYINNYFCYYVNKKT